MEGLPRRKSTSTRLRRPFRALFFRAKDLRMLVNIYCQTYQERNEILKDEASNQTCMDTKDKNGCAG